MPEIGEIFLEVLDTSGTFEFPAMRRLSIEKGDAFILVYSIRDASSWQELVQLRKLILDEKQSQSAAAVKSASSLSSSFKKKSAHHNQTPHYQAQSHGQQKHHSQTTNRNISNRPLSLAARLASAGRRTSSSPALKSELFQRRLSVHQMPENVVPLAVGALVPSAAAAVAKYRRQSSLDELSEAHIGSMFARAHSAAGSQQRNLKFEYNSYQTKVNCSSNSAHTNKQTTSITDGLISDDTASSPSMSQRHEEQADKQKCIVDEEKEEKDSNANDYRNSNAHVDENEDDEKEDNNKDDEHRQGVKTNNASVGGNQTGTSISDSTTIESVSGQLEFAFKTEKTPIVVVANKCDFSLTRADAQVDQQELARIVRQEWVSIYQMICIVAVACVVAHTHAPNCSFRTDRLSLSVCIAQSELRIDLVVTSALAIEAASEFLEREVGLFL